MKDQTLFLVLGWSNDRENEKPGFINVSGQLVIEALRVNGVTRFSNGVAVVEIKKKYGFDKYEGEYVLEPIYNHINNSLPQRVKVGFSPNTKTPAFYQFFSRDGKSSLGRIGE